MSLARMTAATLNALYGWPNPHAVEFVAKLDAGSVVNPLPPGSCVHLNSSGNFLPGVGTLKVMPMFTFQASDDKTVSLGTGGNPATDKGAYVGVTPSGNMMALPANGAYELVSTNFDATSAPYFPNDPVTSPVTSGGGVNAGTLTRGIIGTHTICGLVSRGVTDNGHGVDALAFWPWFIPAP